MPAKSKAQQRAAGMALAAKEGDMDPDDLQGAAKDMYDSMSKKELEKIASTKHDGLPDKKESTITENNARQLWKMLKGTLGGLFSMGASQALDTLSNMSPEQFNKLEKAVRLIGNVLSGTDIMASHDRKNVRSMIEDGADPADIISALSEESKYNLRVAPGDALEAHHLIMDNPHLAKQQPAMGHSDVFQFDDQESLVAAEELLGKYNIDVEEINGL